MHYDPTSEWRHIVEAPFYPPLPEVYLPSQSCIDVLRRLLDVEVDSSGNDLLEMIEARAENVLSSSGLGNARGQTYDEVVAIVAYTAEIGYVGGDKQRNLYLRLNRILGERNKNNNFHEFADWYWYLISGIKKIPPEAVATLYRGVGEEELAEHYHEGSIKCWPRITSMSAKREVSTMFLEGEAPGTLLEIKCINAYPIFEYSLMDKDVTKVKEQEYVLLPNTYVRVVHSNSRSNLELLSRATDHSDLLAKVCNANVIEVHEVSIDQLVAQLEETTKQLQKLNEEKFKFMPFFVEGIVHEKEAVFMDRFTQISAKFRGHGDLFDDVAVAWNYFCTMNAVDAGKKGLSRLLDVPHFRMFLEAPAGSGKTTIIKWIAREVEKLKNRHGNPLKCAVVVELLRLEEYFQSLGPTVPSWSSSVTVVELMLSMPDVIDYAGKVWFRKAKDCAKVLTNPLVMDSVLYIFDGFDELPRKMSPMMRTLILALQDETMEKLPFMRHVIVTSRPERIQSFGPSAALFTENRFVKMKLEPWSEKACTEYVRRFPRFMPLDVLRVTRAIANPSFDVFERRPLIVHLVCAALAHHRRELAYAWALGHVGAKIRCCVSSPPPLIAAGMSMVLGDGVECCCVIKKEIDGKFRLTEPDGQTIEFSRGAVFKHVQVVSQPAATGSTQLQQAERQADYFLQYLVQELTVDSMASTDGLAAASDTTQNPQNVDDSLRKLDVMPDLADSPSVVLEWVIDHTLEWKAMKNHLTESECAVTLDNVTKCQLAPLVRRQKRRLAEIAFAAVTGASDASRTLVTLTDSDCLVGRLEEHGGSTVDGLDLERCGLFEPVVTRGSRNKYKFLHKTVVEFLAARYIVDHIDDPVERNSPLPYERLELTESMVLFFLADILRQKLISSLPDPTSSSSTLAVLKCVAKKFTQRYKTKEKESGVELTADALVAMGSAARSRCADELCVQAVLTFFYTVLPRSPPCQRDKNDPDGTQAAFDLFFKRCNKLNMLDRAAAWFNASRPAWRYLLIEPAARIGALYVLHKVHTEGIDKTHMTWAALEAASTVTGERVVQHLLKEWGVSVSIEDAVILNHTGALKALLLTSPDESKIQSVKDWTPLLHQAKALNDKTALRILVEFLTTSPRIIEPMTDGPGTLAVMFDELATATESAYVISAWSETAAYWIATIPRLAHQVTSISWVVEAASLDNGVCVVTDTAFREHKSEVASVVSHTMAYSRTNVSFSDAPLVSHTASLCFGWVLSNCSDSASLRTLIDNVRDIPLMTLQPDILRRYVEWERLRFTAADPKQWRHRMEVAFIPVLAAYASQDRDDCAVGSVLSLMVAPAFFSSSAQKQKLRLPVLRRLPLGFNAEGGSFDCFEFAKDQPRIDVGMSALLVVSTMHFPSSILNPTRKLRTLSGHTHAVYCTAFSPDGGHIVTSSLDKAVKIWSTITGKCVQTLWGHGASVYTAAYAPDGRHIVTGSLDKTAKIWDVNSGECLITLTGHKKRIYAADYACDGRHIVTASWDKKAMVWDAITGKCVQTLTGHSAFVYSAVYAPDGRFIATGSWDMTAKVWETSSGTCVRTLDGHTNTVCAVAFSPDGRRIVTASLDETAIIWDTRTGSCVQTLVGHSSAVRSARYSPDGRHITTCSADKTAKIWDAATGTIVLTLTGHRGWLRCSAYSPDGRHVVTVSDDTTAMIWETSLLSQNTCLQRTTTIGGAHESKDNVIDDAAKSTTHEDVFLVDGEHYRRIITYQRVEAAVSAAEGFVKVTGCRLERQS